jgi:hypothetical protein
MTAARNRFEMNFRLPNMCRHADIQPSSPASKS